MDTLEAILEATGGVQNQQRSTPEFKDEEVRQVTEKAHSVQDVAARLGVSNHSLYKWAVKPDKAEQRADELLDAKKEILKLRAELRRIEEERDILKKPRRTLQRSPSEVRLYPRAA